MIKGLEHLKITVRELDDESLGKMLTLAEELHHLCVLEEQRRGIYTPTNSKSLDFDGDLMDQLFD